MAEQNLVVARYLSGKTLKGSTQDFHPSRPVFHLRTNKGEAVTIKISDLKVVCFVKDLIGDRTRKKTRKFCNPESGSGSGSGQGKKIAVLFKDGELIVGHTLAYTPERQGFFLFPSDTRGNNERIYIVTSATKTVKVGLAAEQLAHTTPANQRPSRAA